MEGGSVVKIEGGAGSLGGKKKTPSNIVKKKKTTKKKRDTSVQRGKD